MASTNEQSTCADCAANPSRAAYFEHDDSNPTIGSTHDGNVENHYHAHVVSHEDHEEDNPCEGNCRSDEEQDRADDTVAVTSPSAKKRGSQQKTPSKKVEQNRERHQKTESKKVEEKPENQQKTPPKKVEQKSDSVPNKSASVNNAALDTTSKVQRNSQWDASGTSEGGYPGDSSAAKQPRGKRSARNTGNSKKFPLTEADESDDDQHSELRGKKPEVKHSYKGKCGLCAERPHNNTSRTEETESGSISLYNRRRLIFAGFSDSVASKLGNEIAKYGGNARISKARPWGGCYEFKLKGDPWGQFKSTGLNAITSQFFEGKIGMIVGDAGSEREEIFLHHMFRVMHLNGYSLTQVQQSIRSPGTFYYEQSPNPPRGTMECIAIGFHNPNRLRVTFAPEEFIEALEGFLDTMGLFKGERKKTQKEREKQEKQRLGGQATKSRRSKKEKPVAVEYKLPNLSWEMHHPWFSYAREKRGKITHGKQMRVDLIKFLSKHGWKDMATIERAFRANNEGDEHVGTVWYYYKEDNVPGKSSEKEMGLAASILQKVVGGSSKADA